MYRFLLSWRWLGFALAVIAGAAVCVLLGQWQFSRGDGRAEHNAVIEANIDAPPVPLATLAEAGGRLDPDDEWTPVTVAGRYDPSRELTLKYQTRDSRPGAEIVTPLLLDDGSVVLVNRGWMTTSNTSRQVENIPPAANGPVEVTGWIRRDSTASGNAIVPDAGQIRAISTAGLAEWIDAPLYPGYIDLIEQRPPAGDDLRPRPEPDLSAGPHFFYGLQWWFFGALALFGFCYFAYAEVKDRREGRPPGRGEPSRPGPGQASETRSA